MLHQLWISSPPCRFYKRTLSFHPSSVASAHGCTSSPISKGLEKNNIFYILHIAYKKAVICGTQSYKNRYIHTYIVWSVFHAHYDVTDQQSTSRLLQTMLHTSYCMMAARYNYTADKGVVCFVGLYYYSYCNFVLRHAWFLPYLLAIVMEHR